MQWTIWLADGTLFDSTYLRDNTMTMRVSDVFPGWGEALAGMRAGGKRRVALPAGLSLGRGGFSARGFPPDTEIVIEFELFKVKNPEPPKPPAVAVEASPREEGDKPPADDTKPPE